MIGELLLRLGSETQAAQHRRDLELDLVAIAKAKAVLDLAVAREDRLVLRLADRRVAKPLLEVVHLHLQIEEVLEREARFVFDAAAAVRQAVLRQVAKRQRVGFLDEARVGLVEAGQHLQQRGLAGAVGPAQADAIAVADLPGDMLQQGLFAEGLGDVLQLEHYGGLGT